MLGIVAVWWVRHVSVALAEDQIRIVLEQCLDFFQVAILGSVMYSVKIIHVCSVSLDAKPLTRNVNPHTPPQAKAAMANQANRKPCGSPVV
jgi:hypothetical protein